MFPSIQNQMLEHLKKSCMALNDDLAGTGIVLTENDVSVIVHSRTEVLNRYGRIGLNTEIIETLIVRFSTSPFIQPSEFVEVVSELYEIFQYIKHETDDMIFDEEIVVFMEEAFNGPAQGSLAYLAEKEATDFINGYRGLED